MTHEHPQLAEHVADDPDFPLVLEHAHADIVDRLGGPCETTTMRRGDLFGMHDWDLARLPLDDATVTHVAAEYVCDSCGREVLRRRAKRVSS